MKESKSQLTNRLRKEGRWEEASLLKDETIRRLRSEGMKRPDAQAAAWEAMEEKYPPLDEPLQREQETPDWSCFAELPSSNAENYFQDAVWVYERLAASGVKPHDAPTPGAWSLLCWARNNEDRFFEQIMPKVYNSHQKSKELESTLTLEAMDDLSLVKELLEEEVHNWERRLLQDMPETVKSDVNRVVGEVLESSEHHLAQSIIERLTCKLTKLVDDSIKAALQNPGEYAGPGPQA